MNRRVALLRLSFRVARLENPGGQSERTARELVVHFMLSVEEIVGAIQPRRPKRVGSERCGGRLVVHRPRGLDTPRSSRRVSMDTASPISGRGQSTTLATGTVGARCPATLSEHAAHPSLTYAYGAECTCSHIVRQCSSQLQISRWRRRHRAGYAAQSASACALCRLPTREPRPRVHAQACKLQTHHSTSTTWTPVQWRYQPRGC